MKFNHWFAFSKTCRVLQTSLMGIPLESFSGRLPKSGMFANGSIYERVTRALRISANAGSAWPTPRAHVTHDDLGNATLIGNMRMIRNGREYGLSLGAAVIHWPTPQAFDANTINRSPEALERAKTLGGCSNLREHPEIWATPQARDWKGVTGVNRHSKNVPDQVQGNLNPAFVELLMGYPPGYTSIPDGLADPVSHSTITSQRARLQKQSKTGRRGLKRLATASCHRSFIPSSLRYANT